MSRVQLALNVTNLNDSIDFYAQVFKTPAHKVRPGYANFQIDNPPLKLVLIENQEDRGTGTVGALNHLGVEVPSADEVHEIIEYLGTTGLVAKEEIDVQCCHAKQDKVWVHDPSGAPWEFYAITDDTSDGMAKEVPADCC